ncbi:MAG TPA: DNA topology modulation protein [Staphylococcus kloosii]|uniref:DNA topology modulation protein n=1 Tax=Staphylococcus kloosii TaxID=29384 RepID=A0A921GXM2_9STAP|nr:DNA topology modulation protein [Staphylococcus kloosii]HJF66676.1 DNA topology modulation protein [Staphylococcus kloosii]
MQKIIVIGSSGSGKSTFSRKLSRAMNIPVYHLDALFWKPNWNMRNLAEKIDIQEAILKQEKWIIDGNYTDILDDRLKCADTVIFLDLPRIICYYRVFTRLFKNLGKTRIDMGSGCKERISFTFLTYIWKYPKHKKPFLLYKFSELNGDKNVYHLNKLKDINAFIKHDAT